MSTQTTHTPTEEIQHVASAGALTFAKVWISLLVLTGIELLLTYEQVPTLIMLTALLGLSIVKAALIIAYFMHLRFERLSLFLTLFPMLIFCIIVMLIFLGDAYRIPLMRPPQ
jgi:cytochrome c oxidase subunit IV